MYLNYKLLKEKGMVTPRIEKTHLDLDSITPNKQKNLNSKSKYYS